MFHRPTIARPVVVLALVTMTFASGHQTALAESTIVKGEPAARVDEYCTRLTGLGFSGVLAVDKGGELILLKGYGLANRESKRPVTPGTVFTIGSITKQFTGAAMMKLVMDGKVDVSDKISKYLPDVPADKKDITIHQLLTHSAGFPGSVGSDYDPKGTREEVYRLAMERKLLFSPGSRYEYSNVGYTLAAMIVENVSGTSYEQFLYEHLFKPVGMDHTGYTRPGFKEDDFAIGYRGDERWGTIFERPMLSDGPNWHLRGNGGIHSTAGDMYRWHKALNGTAVLSDAAKKEYFAPHMDEGSGDSFYGYGWVNFKTPRGTRLLAHNGGNGIYSADCRRYVDENAFVFAACNADIMAWQITNPIARIIFGMEQAMPPKVIEPDNAKIEAVQGVYQIPSVGRLEVRRSGSRLELVAHERAVANVLLGSDAVDDKMLDQAEELSVKVARAWAKEDFDSVKQYVGGGFSPETIATESRNMFRMATERLGGFEDVEAISVSSAERGIRVVMEMRHKSGSWYMDHLWNEHKLIGLGVDEVPPPTGQRVEVYPTSDTRYESFSLTDEVTVVAEFADWRDGMSQTLSISVNDGDAIRAQRVVR